MTDDEKHIVATLATGRAHGHTGERTETTAAAVESGRPTSDKGSDASKRSPDDANVAAAQT